MKLREQAELCDFEDLEGSLKEQLTEGCSSKELKKKVMKHSNRTLDEILKDACINEMIEEDQNGPKKEKTIVAEAVNKIEHRGQPGKQNNGDRGSRWGNRALSRTRPDDRSSNQSRDNRSEMRGTCHRCGYLGHLAADPECPAKGKECHRCGGRDHFSRKCMSRKRGQPNPKQEEADVKRPKTEETVRLVNDDKEEYAEYA